jgi:selenoprotein W-related protein
VSLTEKILKKLKTEVSSYELVPSAGGVFELEVDGKLVFSKKQEGRFPEWKEVAPKLGVS